MKPQRNIKRVDQTANRTHAWFVTLQRWNQIHTKIFSDALHGGKRKAFKAAIAYRDALLNQYSTLEHQLWVRTRLRKNNTSGIPGVCRYERAGVAAKFNEHRFAYWLASWVNEFGQTRQRKFAVSVHGERQAKALAIAERARQLKRVCDIKAAR